MKCLWFPLWLLISLNALSAEPATKERINALEVGFGYSCGVYLTECYLSLVDAENARGSSSSKSVATHLSIQSRTLEGIVEKLEAVIAAYPDDKDTILSCSQLKETATALLAQNEALREYLSGESKNLQKIRMKRAASRKLLIRALSMKEDGNLP